VEARLAGFTERRVLDASEASLSCVLAGVCGPADFRWSRISNLNSLPAPPHHSVSRSCFGGNGVQGKRASWVQAFPTWNGCGWRCPGRQVRMGVQPGDLRVRWIARYGFALEHMATSRQIEPGGNLPRLPYRRILRRYSGEHHDYKKEN
jgi:hypothetical protein